MSDIFGNAVLPSMKARQKRLCLENQKPRAKAVYEDANNFGAKLLSKMGWSEGKGLGVKEDGLTAPIIPKYKKDNEGFGYAGEKDDHWTQHHQDFEGLLKSLNGSNNPSSNSNSGDEVTFKSLEEKSKRSRARVHYRKFTRGKDLTLASKKDLANIFGKKTLDEVKKAPPPMVLVGTAIEKEEKDVENGSDEKTFGLMTVNTGKSVQDYFKEKMQALKRKHEAIEPLEIVEDSLDCEPAKKKPKRSKNEEVQEETIENLPKKKKKKSKQIEENVADQISENFTEAEANKEDTEEIKVELVETAPKKKKKKNVEDVVQVSATPELNDPGIQESVVEAPPKKKKKKDKKALSMKEEKIEDDLLLENPSTTPETHKVKGEGTHDEVVDETISKKKNKDVQVEETFEAKILEENQDEIETEKKHKKSKKKKNQEKPEKAEQIIDPMLFELIQSQRREKVIPKVTDPKNELNLTEMGSLVLQQVDPMGFVGSNFSDIIGYGLTTNVKLVTQSDSQYQSDQILKLQYRKTSTSNQYQRKLRKKVGAFTSI